MILIFVIVCLIFFFYNLTKLRNYIDFQQRFIQIEQIKVLDKEKAYLISDEKNIFDNLYILNAIYRRISKKKEVILIKVVFENDDEIKVEHLMKLNQLQIEEIPVLLYMGEKHYWEDIMKFSSYGKSL